MFTAHEVHDDREIVDTSFAILQEVFSEYHPRNFSVRLWNGAFWDPEPGEHERFRLVLTHPGSLRAMFTHPTQLTLGEAYVRNDFDIEGDIEAAFAMAGYLLNLDIKWTEKVHLASLLRKLPVNGHNHTVIAGRKPIRLKGALHSKERDRQAVTYHYDVSNEFFSLWLDPQMVYSCAYFLHPNDSLESAQEQKLEYLCRKLDLHSGDRLLDLGCGWGGLICFAAKTYGVRAH
ncbi:MAG TPA: class I SAM-dependent methyltransferase, partial [Bacteroidota bacterium]|nr:class I SAM-dependent methyltransferase [Bacteroidota bacterium]